MRRGEGCIGSGQNVKKRLRIFFYSHDTFGLGHIRRTQKIANSLAGDDRSILIACSSPKASSFASQSGIEYLNLPGFTKQVSGDYVPRSLNISLDEFVNLRSHLLLSAIRSFSPDIIIVDKEPLGVKGELLPALDYVKNFLKKTRVICGYRDILDNADAVFKEWKRRGTEEALENYFDDIFIYGEKEHFNFSKEYSLSETLTKKLFYTGYINPSKNLEKSGDFRLEKDHESNGEQKVVTLTLGGGGDGWDFFETYLDWVSRETMPEVLKVVLCGPFMKASLFERAKELSSKIKNFECFQFIENTESLFRKSHVVLSMGGYNSFCELAGLRKKPIILPRIIPREEQLIRAKVFSSLGFCKYIHPDQLSIESLEKTVRASLEESEDLSAVPKFEAKGLVNISELVGRHERILRGVNA